jgi:hypothetical protein
MTASTGAPCKVREHVSRFFPHRKLDVLRWKRVPIQEALPGFEILRLAPNKNELGWLFFSNGASTVRTSHGNRYEFFVISPIDDPIHIETLSMVAAFAADPDYAIYPGKILEIGRSWIQGSNLDHLLVSLPYPFGPGLEQCGQGSLSVQILWLQPISSAEVKFAEKNGLEALECEFERQKIDYVAISRPSVVSTLLTNMVRTYPAAVALTLMLTGIGTIESSDHLTLGLVSATPAIRFRV